LGTEVGFQLMRDEYNPRCEPRWSDAELWHKVNDADRLQFGKPRGWLRDAPLPEWPLVTSGSGSKPGGNGDGRHEGDGVVEKDTDPHRLGRVFNAGFDLAAGCRLRYHQEQFHEWGRAA